jgi:TRAP transporter TAXI family solute receptor
LKEKRINAGTAYSRTRQAVELILNTKGWSLEDFKSVEALPSSQSQDNMAFCHGTVQAMLHIGVHPDSALEQLISLCNALPVDMNDADIKKLVQGHPAYSMVSIADATYPTLGRSVSTLGFPVVLVASGSLDDETVRTILSLLDSYQKPLQQAHPAMGGFDPGKPMPDLGIPLHPGAAAFLEQR